jgi:hypothetical protein
MCLSTNNAALSPFMSNSILRPRVALTREGSKNAILGDMLKDLDCVSIPCISYESGKDDISMTLLHDHDVVVVSSPQVSTCITSNEYHLIKSGSGSIWFFVD